MTDGSVPVRDRLVSIEADLGDGAQSRWRYGSGLLIGGRRVLTAAHVVKGAKTVSVRRPGGELRPADLATSLVGEPDGVDLAVLEVPTAEALGPVPVAVVNRDVTDGSFVQNCWAVGYPAFQEIGRDGGRSLRETAEVRGEIPPLSGLQGGLLSLLVTSSPQRLPSAGAFNTSEWSGMSGAAVFAGDLLIGVVTEHAAQRGASEVMVTPLARLWDHTSAPADAREWLGRLLGGVDPAALPRLPLPSVRPPPAYRATLRMFRSQTLVGRDHELQQIADFAVGAADADGSDKRSAGYQWFVGGAWSGKTALMAEAVHTLPDAVDVVAYFLIAREANASQGQFLTAVVPQLTWLLDVHDPLVIDLAAFRDLWARAAARAERLGRHLLLMVDGLDEDLQPDGRSVAALLPVEGLGAHARVLVASRRYSQLPGDVDVNHPLRVCPQIGLTDSSFAADLKLLAEQEIRELLRSDQRVAADLAFKILGLLTAAAGPLSTNDLAALTETSARVVRPFVSERAARSLQAVGNDGNRRYMFAHQGLLEYCQNDPDVGGDIDFRGRLDAWADEWRRKKWPVSEKPSDDTPQYLLDSYPKALRGATGTARLESAQRLADFVSDVGWLDTAVLRIGVDSVLATLRDAARVAPADAAVTSRLRLLELQARHLRAMNYGAEPGRTATQMAWEALRDGDTALHRVATDRIRSCSGPQLLPLWTTERTGRHLIRIIGYHDDWVTALAATGDGKIGSTGADGAVRLWDPDTAGDPGRELGRHDGAVYTIVITADGKVITGGADGAVRLWDPDTAGDPGRELGRHDGAVYAVAVTADGKVISGGEDRAIRLWDPDTAGDPGRELGRHAGKVYAIAVTGEGKVVSGGGDRVVRLWDPDPTGSPNRILGRHDDWVRTVAVTGENKVVSGGDDATLRLWDPDDAEDRGQELGLHHGAVRAASVSGDGKVVSAGSDGAVRLWDPSAPGDPGQELGGHDGEAWAVTFLGDGRVVSGGGDRAVRLWEVSADLQERELGRHDGWSWAVAVTGDGKVVSGGDDGAVMLWNPSATDQPGRELGRHDSTVRAVAVTGDGKVISGGDDGAVRMWDPSTPSDPGRELGYHNGTVRTVAVARDGKVVSGGDDGAVLLWNPSATDQPGRELGRHDSTVMAVAVTGDGKVISGAGDGAVRLWNPTAPGDPGRELGRHHGTVMAVAVTGDGKVISGGDDGAVRLWNPTAPGDPGRELGRHDSWVMALATAAGELAAVLTLSGITVFRLVGGESR